MENIFEKGCLIQLSISQWSARRKIDKTWLTKMSKNHEWLNATKKLVDPEALKPIAKIANAARNYLHEVSLPFPVTGLLFIPKDMISVVDERLQDFKAQYEAVVKAFIKDYKSLRDGAKNHLGDLFNELDYPIDIDERFGCEWRFIVIGLPDGSANILSPEVYERERQKFVETMEEAREMAVETLREEFADLVEHICDRFGTGEDGEPKIFKNATVDSFYKYFETFKSRNIFKDEDLEALVDKAQSILKGKKADAIRSNDLLKRRIRKGMTDVEKGMEVVFTKPRRQIRI